jgi:serine/threonine protein kinase
MVAGRVPERIDTFLIDRELPGGGTGTGYLACDPDRQHKVVIKLAREAASDPELVERFCQEASAIANLRHDNIVSVHGFGLHEGRPYIAMEFVEGPSLQELVRRRAPVDLSTKLSYIEQICAGLYCAHQEGIVHRDVKPANLMLDRRGIACVLGFGIAGDEGSGLANDSATMGTRNYVSPEQVLGQPVDFRSDIFSVGAVAYALISYQQAFPGTPQDGLLHRLPHEPPRPLSELCTGLPDGLECVVMRALEKEPQARFPSLEAMRAAVKRIRRNLDPGQQPTLLVTSKRADPRLAMPWAWERHERRPSQPRSGLRRTMAAAAAAMGTAAMAALRLARGSGLS